MLLIAALLTYVGLAPSSASQAAADSATRSPCLTHPDTSAIHVGMITRTVTFDSARVVALNLPYRPDSISLVTDSTVCQFFVDRWNSEFAGPSDPRYIDRAYVFRIGTNVYAVVGEKQNQLAAGYVYYDEYGNCLAGLVAN